MDQVFKFIAEILFPVFGGLGIFLLGMKNMSEGMQAVAGERIRKLIGAVTNNRLLACGVGTTVTSIVQSSSVTTVMVVGMVNAGLMTLIQAIGVILGANIGTTITGWILVLKVGKYGLPMIGLAAFFFLFSKKERVRFTAMVFVGLGMVFFGLQLMKNGFSPIQDMPKFTEWFQAFQPTDYLGIIKCVLAGAILTAIVQSSSATLGITMGLAATGTIDYPTAAALVLGENIGTTITALLASIGTSTTARRAAYAHTLFNTIGVLWITLLFFPYTNLVSRVINQTRVDNIPVIVVTDESDNRIREYAKKYDIEESLYVSNEEGKKLNSQGYRYDQGVIYDKESKSVATFFEEEVLYVLPEDFIDYMERNDLTNLPFHTIEGRVEYPFTGSAIALTHSGFNIVNTLLFIPFAGLLARFLMWLVPEKKVPEKPRLTYLNVRMLDTPAIGVQQSYKEVIKMGTAVNGMLDNLKKVLGRGEPNASVSEELFQEERNLDVIQMEIMEFLGDIMAGNISHDVVHEGRSQLRISDEFESISDYITNILKLRLKMQDTNQMMSDEGIKDISDLHEAVTEYIKLVSLAVQDEERSPGFFTDAKIKGNAVTKLMKECRTRHLARVGTGDATPLKSLIYTDMLTAYRRIKDHAFNIAEVLIGEK
ncbi:MAG: Na/Pi cotransporter family protein [Planctomycetota bacterium]